MGYELEVDGNASDDIFATISGLAELDDWFDSLDGSKYPALSNFLKKGESKKLKDLQKDIEAVMPLANKDVKSILKVMLKNLKRAKKRIAIIM